ncbi:hypothetical protein F511_08612 [Dorcoceras hygrometricum]|uniref:Uncharacterized protein n=1 Tax=Dorcoceras hygrometricum TaxID=472368 RepID=A0A2Z7CID6_9LAMI|nr:hypothetical protein F511_08612 [Dorcoceras hygrometricum]
MIVCLAVPQNVYDKEEIGEEAEAEQANPVLDPYAYRQHHPLQRQAPPLASYQARFLSVAVAILPSLA